VVFEGVCLNAGVHALFVGIFHRRATAAAPLYSGRG
jgi:hypothetical protein